MYQQKDPWDWTNDNQQEKRISNTIAPLQASQEQAPAPQHAGPGPMTQFYTNMALIKGTDAAVKGVDKGVDAYRASQAINSPLSANLVNATNPAAAEEAFQLADAAQLANQGLEAGQIASTIGSTAAPLSAETVGALGTAAADTAAATGAATASGVGGALASAAPAAATALGEGAATAAATNAWNPIGWAAMAYLGGKALKLW